MTEHVVGAKPLKIPEGVQAGAVFEGHGACYRYALDWHIPSLVEADRAVMFLLMNPSVADHTCADRTVLKCWRYARSWGFTRLLIGNAAAYRATDQKRLAEAQDPVGRNNPWWLLQLARRASMIVVAHGKPHVPAARQFGPAAAQTLRAAGHSLHVLRLLPDGTPEHPLYLPGDLVPVLWPAA